MKTYLLPIHGPFIPPFNLEALLLALIVMVLAKLLIEKLIKKLVGDAFACSPRKCSYLDESYYYHLCIVLLIHQQDDFITFDVCLWLCSFVVPGILIKALQKIVVAQDRALEGMADATKHRSFFTVCRYTGKSMFLLALSYGIICIVFFHRVKMSTLCLLLFPTCQLLIEGVFLRQRSRKLLKNLSYFVGNNQEGLSPIIRVDIIRKLALSVVRVAHFAHLAGLFGTRECTIMRLVECPWVALLLWNIFLGLWEFLREAYELYKLGLLEEQAQESFKPAETEPLQMCTICREDMLKCYKIDSCGHRFHHRCIVRWTFSQPNTQCPVCRGGILRKRRNSYCCVKQSC